MSGAAPPEPAADVPPEPQARRTAGRTVRVSSFAILVLAFLLLAGAVAAAAWGQLKTGKTAPVVSMGLSTGAVIFTLVALWLRPKR